MSKRRTIDPERLAEVFAALASPHRLRILERLATCCPPDATDADTMPRCVGELGKDLGIAPSTVSHHIKELRRAGLIDIEREGRNVVCCVDRETLRHVADFLTRAVPDI